MIEQPLRVCAVLAIIIFGKTVAAFALVLLFRYPLNTALTVSASLAQIGEFSFILAGLGASLGLLTIEGQNLILASALFSIALNPLLFNAVEPLQRWIRSRSRLARAMERPADPLAELPMTVDARRLTGHALLQREEVGQVLMGEHELALSMTRYVMDHLSEGKAPEQPA